MQIVTVYKFCSNTVVLQSRDRKMAGDYIGARSHASTARCLNILALVVILLITGLVFIKIYSIIMAMSNADFRIRVPNIYWPDAIFLHIFSINFFAICYFVVLCILKGKKLSWNIYTIIMSCNSKNIHVMLSMELNWCIKFCKPNLLKRAESTAVF